MLSILDLKKMVGTLDAKKFVAQLGPFVLIQRPPEVQAEFTNGGPTSPRAYKDPSSRMLALLLEFEDLMVATLPPLREQDILTVGRLPTCELPLTDKSVSKEHARLLWNRNTGQCTVEDTGSTNGTEINSSTRISGAFVLKDGDVIGFGDEQFWFLMTETLHAKLLSTGSVKLGSHSG